MVTAMTELIHRAIPGMKQPHKAESKNLCRNVAQSLPGASALTRKYPNMVGN
jgi:hypothetical protein